MQQTTLKKPDSAELQILKSNPGLMPLLRVGDLIQVRLLERANKAVYFDIPKIGTGVIYGSELVNAKDILKKLNIGDEATARVVGTENEDGLIELSLAEAGKQKAWQEIKELEEKGEPIKIKVIAANAGGLIAEIGGVQAFLPSSQLSNEHYPQGTENDRGRMSEELKKFVGEELSVKIINLNPRTNKLIVSEREASAQNTKDLLKKYNQGDVIPGIISGVANFGAFIRFADSPEIEGLIHISELDHRLIDNPKEIVKVGDLVQAKIVEIKDGRVSLSLKALKTDPWDKIEEKYKQGMTIKGSVYKLTPFGAFIKLDSDILGLIHVSEFGSEENLKASLKKDEVYDFIVDSLKPLEKKLVLKLKDPIHSSELKK